MTEVFDLAATPLSRGTTLIEASAGTGKTYTITALYLRLLLEEGLEVSQILVTTYTEAATAELRDRIRSRLNSALSAFYTEGSGDELLQALVETHDRALSCARLERALRDFDQAAIHTIHGFCQRMLQERSFESGMLFDAELVADQEPLLRELVDDFWRIHFGHAPSVFGGLTLSAKLSPDRLLDLLRGAIPRPLLRVIPEIQTDAFDGVKVEVRSLYDSLCNTWTNDGDTVRSQLLGPPKWASAANNLGKPDVLNRWFQSLSRCLCGNGAPAEEFRTIPELRQSKLEKARLKSATAPAHKFFQLCEHFTPLPKRFELCTQVHFLQWARRELQRRKIQQNVLCFDDLLTRLHSALMGPSGDVLADLLRERFRAALIDEFQDTDGIQEAIFQKVFGRGEGWLYFIGDPKQAIYGFRGADIFTYLSAAETAQQRYTLKTNWRSAGALVGAVNHLFGRAPGAFVFDGIEFEKVEAAGERDSTPLFRGDTCAPPLKIWAWETEEPIRAREAQRNLPRATAAAIAELLAANARIGEKPLHPSQIAVLVAKHRQARLVQEALLAFRIPSVLLSDESVWHSREARELHTILAAVVEPTREAGVRAALSTEILGATVSQLEALAQGDREWEYVLLRFARYHERWIHYGFIQMFRTLLLGERVRSRLLSLPDGDRRLTNLLHLAELLHRASTERRLGPAALLRWFVAQRGTDTPSREDDSILRLERDDDAVQIITMHRSKGLEFEVVFCPFAWGETEKRRASQLLVFHDPAQENRLTLDLGSENEKSHRALLTREHLAEQVRLLYVALTRAMHECHFVWGRFNQCEISAAAWLLHRPPSGEGDCAESLRSHMEELTPEQFTADLRSLSSLAPESIEVTPLPGFEAPVYHAPELDDTAAVAPRIFRSQIDREWCVSSFSSLIEGSDAERRDYDRASVTPEIVVDDVPDGIHAFPAGRRAGICLHAVFEELDFSDAEAIEPLVQRKLTAYSFDSTDWGHIVAECVRRTLSVTLPDGFALRDVARRACLPELEFYLPAHRLDARALRQLLEEDDDSLQFESRRGWLKGFIDLVFEHRGRFYIIDWKSNRLGTNSRAYSTEALAVTMARQRYTLQLHLYTVALHRYLKCRIADYDYEQHFGGVMYMFVRGIDLADESLGVHFQRPEKTTIENLSQWLDGEQ